MAARAIHAQVAGRVERLDPVLAQLALKIERPTCFAGERCRLRLDLALSRRAVDENWILPYQRSGDVPVELRLPWLEQLSAQPTGHKQLAQSLQMIVNGQLWPVQHSGLAMDSTAEWLRVQLALEWTAGRPGTLELKGGSLRTFEGEHSAPTDLFQRPPSLARELWLELPEATITVLELPRAGRPVDFSGAVGQFELRARVDRAQIATGQTLELHLRLQGAGDLQSALAPRLDPMPGLALQGMLEQPWKEGRHFVFQLQVLDARVRRIAPVAFCYFDPTGLGTYRYAKSDAIALEVTDQGLARPATAPNHGPTGAPSPLRSSTAIIAGALAALLLLGLLLGKRRGWGPKARSRKP